MPAAAAKLVSTGEAARIVGVSSEWIRQLAARGEVPPVLVTSLGLLFDVGLIEKYARERAERCATKPDTAEFRGTVD